MPFVNPPSESSDNPALVLHTTDFANRYGYDNDQHGSFIRLHHGGISGRLAADPKEGSTDRISRSPAYLGHVESSLDYHDGHSSTASNTSGGNPWIDDDDLLAHVPDINPDATRISPRVSPYVLDGHNFDGNSHDAPRLLARAGSPYPLISGSDSFLDLNPRLHRSLVSPALKFPAPPTTTAGPLSRNYSDADTSSNSHVNTPTLKPPPSPFEVTRLHDSQVRSEWLDQPRHPVCALSWNLTLFRRSLSNLFRPRSSRSLMKQRPSLNSLWYPDGNRPHSVESSPTKPARRDYEDLRGWLGSVPVDASSDGDSGLDGERWVVVERPDTPCNEDPYAAYRSGRCAWCRSMNNIKACFHWCRSRSTPTQSHHLKAVKAAPTSSGPESSQDLSSPRVSFEIMTIPAVLPVPVMASTPSLSPNPSSTAFSPSPMDSPRPSFLSPSSPLTLYNSSGSQGVAGPPTARPHTPPRPTRRPFSPSLYDDGALIKELKIPRAVFKGDLRSSAHAIRPPPRHSSLPMINQPPRRSSLPVVNQPPRHSSLPVANLGRSPRYNQHSSFYSHSSPARKPSRL